MSHPTVDSCHIAQLHVFFVSQEVMFVFMCVCHIQTSIFKLSYHTSWIYQQKNLPTLALNRETCNILVSTMSLFFLFGNTLTRTTFSSIKLLNQFCL